MPGYWELDNRSLAIGILNGRDAAPLKWSVAFRNLRIPMPHVVLPQQGMPFDHARNAAVQQALEMGATYLFFLDDDVVVPPDAIERLLARNLDVVSGLYYRRSSPVGLPVMMLENEVQTEQGTKTVAQFLVNFKVGDLVEAHLVGAGCLLIHRRVLELMSRELDKRPFRWQMEGHIPEGHRVSEDFFFCRELRKRGIQIFVDTGIQCGHVGLAEAKHQHFGPLEW
jgi:hypothetical protein